MSETRNTSAILGSFLLGAAIGAGLAVLFAPAPGSETRRQLGEKARGLGEGAQDKLGSLRDVVKDGMQGAKAAVKEAGDAYRRETTAAYATSDAP